MPRQYFTATTSTKPAITTDGIHHFYDIDHPTILTKKISSYGVNLSNKKSNKIPSNGNVNNYSIPNSTIQSSISTKYLKPVNVSYERNNNKKGQNKQQLLVHQDSLTFNTRNKTMDQNKSSNYRGSKKEKWNSAEISIKSNKSSNKSSKQKDISIQVTLSDTKNNKLHRISQQHHSRKTAISRMHQNIANLTFTKLKLKKVIGDLSISNDFDNDMTTAVNYKLLDRTSSSVTILSTSTITPKTNIDDVEYPALTATILTCTANHSHSREHFTLVALQANQRLTKLFERYEKIQSVYPELHPYQNSRSKYRQYNFNNSTFNNKAEKKKSKIYLNLSDNLNNGFEYSNRSPGPVTIGQFKKKGNGSGLRIQSKTNIVDMEKITFKNNTYGHRPNNFERRKQTHSNGISLLAVLYFNK